MIQIIPDLYVYPVGYAYVTVFLCSMSICLCHVGGHWKTVGQRYFQSVCDSYFPYSNE